MDSLARSWLISIGLSGKFENISSMKLTLTSCMGGWVGGSQGSMVCYVSRGEAVGAPEEAFVAPGEAFVAPGEGVEPPGIEVEAP